MENNSNQDFFGRLLYKMANQNKKYKDATDDEKRMFNQVAVNFANIVLEVSKHEEQKKRLKEIEDQLD